MKTTVYRIQDAKGRGPFKPGFSSSWTIDRPDHENLVPWFMEFGRIDQQVIVGMSSGSACRTLDQLRRWFIPEEYETLKRHGYRAVRMEASILGESDIQLFIQRAKPFREDVEEIELYPTNPHPEE